MLSPIEHPPLTLVAREVIAPTDVLVGDQVTVQWTVANLGSDPAVGPWYDEIRLRPEILVPDGTLSDDTDFQTNPFRADIVVGGAIVGDGLTLQPGQSTTFSTDVRIAPGLIDNYRWVVETNRRADVLETEGRLNNDAFGLESVALDFRELIVDGSILQSRFNERLEPEFFKAEIPADAEVGVALQMLGEGDSVNELYVARDFIPNRVDFQASQTEAGEADVSVAIPRDATSSIVYIMALPASFDRNNADFEIAASVLPASISTASPTTVGNNGLVSIELFGERLSEGVQFELIAEDGARLSPTTTRLIDGTRAVVEFDFDQVPQGVYDIEVSSQNQTLSTLSDAITVEPTRNGPVEIEVLGSSRVRSGRTVRYTVNYHNTSNVNAHLPFITARVTGGGTLIPRYNSEIRSDELVMLAPPVISGSSLMPPDSHGQLSFFYEVPLDEGDFEVEAWGDTIDDSEFRDTTLNWDGYAVSLRPDGSEENSWTQFLADERTRYGETFGDLFQFLENQIVEFGEDGFDEILFVNGQWLFELPEVRSDAVRSFPGDSGTPLDSIVLATNQTQIERIGPFQVRFDSFQVEGESTGDGRQDVYAVVVGNPTQDLPGSRRDASSWNNLFTKTYNLEGRDGENPRVFTSSNGVDSTQFLDDLATVKSAADDDDLIFVAYAGHGDCAFDAEGSLTGGTLRFQDRPVSGAELNSALGGNTRTVAVFDSCHSGILTSDIKAGNVTAVAGADYNQSVQDGVSLSQNLIPLIQKDPNREIHAAIRLAGQAQSQKTTEMLSGGKETFKKNVNTVIQDLRGSTIDRTKTVEESQAFFANLRVGPITELDTDGDGSIDAFQLPSLDGMEPGVVIPDYSGNGRLNENDFRPENYGKERPGRLLSSGEIKVEELTASQQAQYEGYLQYLQKQNAGKEYGRSVFPVLDARGGDLMVDPVDVKKPGGTSDTVKEKQQEEEADDVARGERGRSFDPNEKIGPAGFGEQGFLQNGMFLPFAIYFENDPTKATLPAQEVLITEVLDEDLDLTTFELGDMVVSGRLIDVPSGRSAWNTVLPIEVDGIDLDLAIDAELNFITRTVTWKFESIDPVTGLLTETFEAGFLPVNDASGRGEGHVNYSVRPKSDLPTGTEISGPAEIVFDVNDPLVTNSTLNTIDVGAPTSFVESLPANSPPSFLVEWAGDDSGGAGVATFDILVSENDGPLEIWLDDTTELSAVFTGTVNSSYAFVSVATDQVGNVESAKAMTDTATMVVMNAWTNPIDAYDVNGVDGISALDALIVINELARRSVSDPETGVLMVVPPDGFAPPYYDVTMDGRATALDALRVINELARRRPFESELLFAEIEDFHVVKQTPSLLPPTTSMDPANEFVRPEMSDRSAGRGIASNTSLVAKAVPELMSSIVVDDEIEAVISTIAEALVGLGDSFDQLDRLESFDSKTH